MSAWGVVVITLLALDAHAQHLGPVERPGGATSVGVAGDRQHDARIDGFDGGYWVVWVGAPRTERFVDVYGARLDVSGQPVGDRVPIGVYLYDDWSPNVRCMSELCLAAWSRDDAIVATRLSPRGTVLDQPPIVLSTNRSVDEVEPFIDVEGAAFVVVWGEGNELGRTRVFVDGGIGPVEHTTAEYGWEFSGASAGAAQLLATQVFGEVRLLRFEEDAGVAVTVVGSGTRPQVVRASGDVVVGWETDQPTRPFALRRFSLDGAPRGGAEVPDVASTSMLGLTSQGGTDVTVLYGRGGAVWAGTSSVGAPFSPTQLSGAGLEQARFDSLATALAVKPAARRAELLFSTWSDGGLTLGTTPLNRAGATQRFPSLALGLDGGALVYRVESARTRLELVFIDASGRSLGSPLELASNVDEESRPIAALTGERTQVVWREPDLQTLHLSTVDPARGLFDAGPALATSANGGFGFGASGDTALVCWGDVGGALQGRFITPGGVGAPFQLATQGRHCAVAGEGQRFLVGWTGGGTEVGFALLEADGGTVASGSTPTNGFAGYQGEVAVAAGPNGFLAAWRPGSTHTLEGALLTLRGATLEALPVLLFTRADFGDLAQDEGRFPAVVFDGEGFVVAWDSAFTDGGAEIFSRRVFPDGGVGPFLMLANGPLDQELPALASFSPGRVLAAYSEFEPLPGADAPRLRTRVLADVLEGDRCLDDLECRAGRCSSSRCCTTCDGGVDAGVEEPDAGSSADGGAVTAGPRSFRVGCDCHEAPVGLAVFAALLLLARRGRPR